MYYCRLTALFSIAACSAFHVLVLAGIVRSDTVQLPAQVRDSLARNAELLTLVSVTWEERNSSSLPLTELLRRIRYRPENVTFLEPKTYQFSCQAGMMYMYKLETWPLLNMNNPQIVDKVYRREKEVACNGKDIYVGEGQKFARQNSFFPHLSIDPVEPLKIRSAWKPDNEIFQPTFFYEAGYELPTTFASLRDPPQSLLLYLLKKGATLAALDKAAGQFSGCLIVDLTDGKGRCRFCLDPALGYAVRYREDRSAAGQMVRRSESRDFLESRKGLWLPRSCGVDHFTWLTIPSEITKEPLLRTSFTVSALNHDVVPVERFVLRYTMPGTMVGDASMPEAKNSPNGRIEYSIPADIEDLDAAIRKAIDGTPYTPHSLRGSAGFRWWILIVNVVVLACIAVWLVRRRFGRRGRTFVK